MRRTPSGSVANYTEATTKTSSPSSNSSGGTTTLGVSPATGTLGTEFTLTATVASGGGTKITQGSVNFLVNGALLANVQINSASGAATISTRSLPAGTDSITANYTGTATNQASSSQPFSVTVTGQYTTATTLTSTGTQGNYALSAQVGAFGLGSPTGSVVFMDSSTTPATTLGTVPLSRAEFASTFLWPSAVTPWAGSNSNGVVAGDFNSDGNVDLAVTNYYDSTVSIFLGNGDGSFAAQKLIAVPSGPWGIVAGDFDRDGNLDLATADSGAVSVTILLGHGDGTFQTAPALSAEYSGHSIVAGDFNGDGNLDVVVGNISGTMVSVFLGNGDGTFGPANTFGSNFSGVYDLTVGDFNQDGKLDIATANASNPAMYPGSVGIFLGNGDGTFKAESDVANTSGVTKAIAAADVNLDGKLDLVTGESAGSVSVLLGNGDGTFHAERSYSAAASAIRIADINGDGKPDIMTSSYDGNSVAPSNTVSVLLGDVTPGTFQAAQSYGLGSLPVSLALGDFNDDGRLDIATANYYGFEVSILIGQETAGVNLTGVTLPGSGSGSANVFAIYSGDTNFTTSTSPSIALATTLATASITFAAQPSATVAYASPLSVVVTVAGQMGSNTPTGNVTYTVDSGTAQTASLTAGTVTLNLSGLAVGNHSLVVNYSGDQFHSPAPQQTLSLTITKASQTITLATPAYTYYGTGPYGISASSTSGLAVTLNVVSGPGTLTGNLLTLTGAGTVVLAANQAGDADYNPAPAVQQSDTIYPAALSVTINAANKVYGMVNPAFTSVIHGLVGTDVVTVTYNTTATTTSGVGTYPITATLSGAALANYTPTVTAGTLTITEQPLTVTIASASRPYGTANPTFTGMITGQQNGDVITATYSTIATATSPAGTYPIMATLSGTNLADYAPTITNSTLTVVPAPVVSLPTTPVAFTSTGVGSASAPTTVTFSNTGDAALTGISFSVAGLNATSFSLPPSANLCGTSLAAGASCTFGVVFQPTAPGALSAIIEIADNATGSPQTLAVSGTGVQVPPTVAFDGIGSSGIFLELGLAVSSAPSASPAGLGATCLWTTKTSGVVAATDNSSYGAGKTDSGSAWVAWTPVNGSCNTVNAGTTIYSYLQTDSVVGTRCLFNGCTVKFGGSGSAAAGLISGSSEVPLAPGVAAALNGSSGTGLAVTAAVSDIRPEDAEFATARALTACGAPVAPGSQYLGLGYTNGQTIDSYYSGAKFNVIDFALPPSYSVTSVGVAPVLVVVNGDGTMNGFGDPGLTNITTGVLGLFLDGTFNQTQDALITPQVGSSEPVTTIIQEPLSGAYNVMEYNVPNSQPLKTSQDVGLNQIGPAINCSGTSVRSNPMNLPAGPGWRRRAIGTSEELSESIIRANSLAYGFWSVGNFKGFTSAAAPNAKYLTVDGVDPIQTSYTGGTIPTTPAEIANVTLANTLSGSYPIFSTIRLVNLGASPSSALTSLAAAAQNFAPRSARPDFVPVSQLAINRSHFIPPAGAGLPAAASNGSGKACGSSEVGGDVGGLVVTKAGDFDFCYNYKNTTGVTGRRR